MWQKPVFRVPGWSELREASGRELLADLLEVLVEVVVPGSVCEPQVDRYTLVNLCEGVTG